MLLLAAPLSFCILLRQLREITRRERRFECRRVVVVVPLVIIFAYSLMRRRFIIYLRRTTLFSLLYNKISGRRSRALRFLSSPFINSSRCTTPSVSFQTTPRRAAASSKPVSNTRGLGGRRGLARLYLSGERPTIARTPFTQFRVRGAQAV